jgi:membrane-associated phospholipid phosphatase
VQIFPISLGWNALVIMSAIPIGGHYGVDLSAGALLWLAATLIGATMAKCPAAH